MLANLCLLGLARREPMTAARAAARVAAAGAEFGALIDDRVFVFSFSIVCTVRALSAFQNHLTFLVHDVEFLSLSTRTLVFRGLAKTQC